MVGVRDNDLGYAPGWARRAADRGGGPVTEYSRRRWRRPPMLLARTVGSG